jgi:hypothetical protein
MGTFVDMAIVDYRLPITNCIKTNFPLPLVLITDGRLWETYRSLPITISYITPAKYVDRQAGRQAQQKRQACTAGRHSRQRCMADMAGECGRRHGKWAWQAGMAGGKHDRLVERRDVEKTTYT